MLIHERLKSSDFLIRLGARIREKRERADMDLQQLAILIGLSRAIMSRIETGQNDVSIYRGALIARALGTTLPKLLEGLL